MSNQRPAISVLVPTFNDAEMLINALESVRRQTFRDFEVLIGDDCSTNHTASLAEAFCKKDPRFRCLRYPQNVGMTRHWNRLSQEAVGKYLCKLDGDDAFQPETLQHLWDAVHEHSAAIAFCRTIDCNADLEPVASYYGERALVRQGLEPLQDHQRLGLDWYRLCFDGYQLWHSNAFLISRQIFEEIQGWDNRFGCSTDTDFILRLLERNEMVCHSAYPGVLYRRRKGSVLDTFRKNSWHLMESAVVHLQSLDRVSQKTPKVCRSLRKQWVRHWTLWFREYRSALAGKRNFAGLEAAHANVVPPPFRYRFIGHLQNLASRAKWRLKHR